MHFLCHGKQPYPPQNASSASWMDWPVYPGPHPEPSPLWWYTVPKERLSWQPTTLCYSVTMCILHIIRARCAMLAISNLRAADLATHVNLHFAACISNILFKCYRLSSNFFAVEAWPQLYCRQAAATYSTSYEIFWHTQMLLQRPRTRWIRATLDSCFWRTVMRVPSRYSIRSHKRLPNNRVNRAQCIKDCQCGTRSFKHGMAFVAM